MGQLAIQAFPCSVEAIVGVSYTYIGTTRFSSRIFVQRGKQSTCQIEGGGLSCSTMQRGSGGAPPGKF